MWVSVCCHGYMASSLCCSPNSLVCPKKATLSPILVEKGDNQAERQLQLLSSYHGVLSNRFLGTTEEEIPSAGRKADLKKRRKGLLEALIRKAGFSLPQSHFGKWGAWEDVSKSKV